MYLVQLLQGVNMDYWYIGMWWFIGVMCGVVLERHILVKASVEDVSRGESDQG